MMKAKRKMKVMVISKRIFQTLRSKIFSLILYSFCIPLFDLMAGVH